MSEDTGSNAGGNPLADQSGDTLVMWGALAVLAIWVIFEVITEDYFVATTTVAIALLVAVVPRIDASVTKVFASPLAFAKFGGYFLVASGVTELVGDLRNELFDRDGITIVAALIAYVAYAITFMGARKIEV